MKVPESVVLTWELVTFMLGMASLFVWAAWQDGSAWALRRMGFVRLAGERQAVADATFRDIIGYDCRD
jgi:hypothetical protein